MRRAIHAFFAILAAIGTMVVVFVVKRGVEWETRDWSGEAVAIATAVMIAIFLLMIAWTYLLRSAIERRK